LTLSVYLARLQEIYNRIDATFAELKQHYRFDCTGCPSNCCTTYFYHYTIAEHLFLLKGMESLDADSRNEALERAARMCGLTEKDQYLCPLNVHGFCMLYSHRPMICRIHGLPWEAMQPDGQRSAGPGCDPLERRIAAQDTFYRRMDRTPFFRDLALLEQEVRQLLCYPRRFRKTTAEMLLAPVEYAVRHLE
jgi:Fe-S-cluster containining protein